MRTFPRVIRPAAFFLLALVVLVPSVAQAAEDEETLDAVHHTVDGYYLDFEPFGKVELPRLFLVRRAGGGLGFDVFGSSTAAVASGRYAIDDHSGDHGGESDHAEGAAYAAGDVAEGEAGVSPSEYTQEMQEEAGGELEAEGTAAAPYDALLMATGGSEILVDFSISRHLVFMFLAISILLVLFLPLGSRYKKGVGRTSAPRGRLQNMMETVVIYIRDEIAKPNLGHKTHKYLPYLLTVFFFILACNLLGLVPWGATATANISVTAALAVFTFVITQFAGTKDYWMHIFNPPGVPAFVKPILVPVEILGLFTKPFALAIRLFANLTAGHLVILNLIGLIFIIAGSFGAAAGYGTSIPAMVMVVFVYLLEVLVAFIQAYVFTILSALFIGMATAEHEHEHDPNYDDEVTAHDRAVSEVTPLVSDHKIQEDHERTVGSEVAMA